MENLVKKNLKIKKTILPGDWEMWKCSLDKLNRAAPTKYPYCNPPLQTIFGFKGTPPPVKLKSRLLIGSSPNFTDIKIVSMRPPILNFKSISQFWQP